MFWGNLERINACLWKAIQETVLTDKYNWCARFTSDELHAMSHESRKRFFYLAARRAGQDGFPLLVKQRSLAEHALESWREYWHLTFEQAGISVEKIKVATNVLLNLHERGIYPEGPFPWNRDITEDVGSRLIQATLTDYAPLTDEQIVEALNIGSIAYDFMPNNTAVSLFLLHLPIVDPDNTQLYLKEGDKALQVFELHVYWYAYVEHRKRMNVEFEALAFYKQMLNEWRKQGEV